LLEAVEATQQLFLLKKCVSKEYRIFAFVGRRYVSLQNMAEPAEK